MTDTLLRDQLEHLVRGGDLDVDGARRLMDRVMDGSATPVQVGALFTALRAKGETADELAGMVMSMRDHATPVELGVDAVDTCGTGGDGSGTFNISTAAAFVVAGAGVPVAKHGNRAMSSQCGSADVLEALGVRVALSPRGVRRCMEEAGIAFLFAPAFHPAMRHASQTRREIGIRTAFNVLGPLANPARVPYQALGVGDAAMAATMAAVLLRLGLRRALVFAGHGGLDELSLDGPAELHDVRDGAVHLGTVDPAGLGFATAPAAALRGGNAEQNAARIRAVVDGEPGAHRDVVVLNAAAALVAAERCATMPEAVTVANASIDGGGARRAVDGLARTSQAVE